MNLVDASIATIKLEPSSAIGNQRDAFMACENFSVIMPPAGYCHRRAEIELNRVNVELMERKGGRYFLSCRRNSD